MILSCQSICKSFGEKVILQDASFHIEEREKAALIGNNGAGKTTLLRIIMEEISADSGQVVIAKDKKIGYLAQYQDIHGHHTIYEELMTTKQYILDMEDKIRSLEQEMKYVAGDKLESLMNSYTRLTHQFELENGYAYKSEIVGVLKGLGFEEEDYGKQIENLSGGQKTRVALGKLLISKPDILLLDEPTNHLDMESIAWLETYLLNYPGAVFIVSHDRYFLDKVVTKIVEIEAAQMRMYEGNYSAYALKKAQLRDAQYKAYLNQQREIKHQEAVITKLRSFNREKSIKRAESRVKMLDKIQRIEKPIEIDNQMRISLEPRFISGNDVLTVEGLSKSFPGQTLFTDINFEIKRGERVALIGNNGTGKTTILKILNGIVAADAGRFALGSKVQIGYYDQEHHVLHMEKTIFQEISDTYPTLTETEIRNMLAAFLFTGDDVFKLISSLSGGERGRVSLAKLMLSEANFLILDEPTNHLDMESISWLETYLLNYPGAVFIVSHDRYFLDKVVTKVVEIEAGNMRMYSGNYSAYALKKAQLRDAQYKAYLNQQRDIKHQEAVIAKLKSFNREKSIKRAESREKMLDKVQRIDKPQEIQNQMRISLEPRFVSGNDVLTVESLSKSFPGQTLFSDISFEIKRGERVALIGNNGTGKTTMLKIINGLIDADSGRFTLGSKVQIGYYDQEHHVLHMEKTIFEEISDAYPTLTETEIRNMLAAFLFTGDDVFKLISALSGGERGRVSLAKLMLSEANFLILDEPTNHLDIASKEILEEALNSYTGTVFYVSHDRYFINQTATRILDLTNQAIVNYIGDYDYYLEKKEELTEKYAPAAAQAVTEAKQASDNKLSWQQQKEEQARQRKRENELKKVEARIEELETRDKEIDETMILPDICTNVAECAKLSKEKAAITEELEGLYEKWEELA